MARTKEFDNDAVLHKAMRLFWEQGYEKTSINDLVEHMGIHRRSLYDTFGDKHQLYLLAVDHYSKVISTTFLGGVRSATASQALRIIFDFTIEGIDADSSPGCLFVNMAVELALRDSEAKAKVQEGFARTERFLTEIIRKGQQTGEFTSSRLPEEFAESIHTTLLGLRVLTRASINKEKLYRIAEVSMGLLNY